MNSQQLKLLAGQIRSLLQRSSHQISHSQALDLAAALPGLRNWPEVLAFPDRLTSTELDDGSTGRLASRLNKIFGLDLTPQDLLKILSSEHDSRINSIQFNSGKTVKVSDFIFQFNSERGMKARGLCRVRLFVTSDKQVAAVLTDLSSVGTGSTGPSVTNSVEIIRKALIDRGFASDDTMVIEHYEDITFHGATFDIVTFSQDNAPSWKTVTLNEVSKILNCHKTEFEAITAKNPRLLADIERIRNSIDPFSGSPFPEHPSIVNRRSDIEARMLGKRILAGAIDSGAGETELHQLLKDDLSIFAEIYADLDDEYICFSEFPVGDGFVDFVVFSGRSRMNVTLIEIKGADFYLATTGAYKNFSSKANEAIQQIRARVGVVYRNMETFRNGVHNIRQRVEAGESLHGSFVGPHARLEVDPDKDINVRCVVIAGRTRDDLAESRQRHDYEWSVKPPVKVETWDTFLRKLRRA